MTDNDTSRRLSDLNDQVSELRTKVAMLRGEMKVMLCILTVASLVAFIIIVMRLV